MAACVTNSPDAAIPADIIADLNVKDNLMLFPCYLKGKL
jgi:hypothetical protein